MTGRDDDNDDDAREREDDLPCNAPLYGMTWLAGRDEDEDEDGFGD